MFPARQRTNSTAFRPAAVTAVLRAVVYSLGIFVLTNVAFAAGVREDELKAQALCNLAQFTQWPTNAFAGSNAPLVIAVVGTDPLGPALDDAVRRGEFHGRKVTVERRQRLEDVIACHILFISHSEAPHLDRIVKHFHGKPVLTVSDIPGAASAHGVMVRFFMDDDELKLRINRDALAAAGLNISSKLLRAVEVIPEKNTP